MYAAAAFNSLLLWGVSVALLCWQALELGVGWYRSSSPLTPGVKHAAGLTLKVGEKLIPLSSVAHIDFARIESLEADVYLNSGLKVVAKDIDALEIAMVLKPSILESRRLLWPRWAWLVHNLVGHPVMQLLALARLYKWAFWVHDATVPRPKGKKR